MLVEYGTRRILVVAGLMLAVLLEIADTTIVNVALPTIQGNIGADLDEASWIVTGYLIAVVIALPLVPWFESLLGRKRYVTAAILGFTAASVCCGLAQSVDALVACRIAQGLFGGGILTSARSILRDTFPPELLGWSQGLLAFGAVVGPSIGPTVGGLLTDAFSWRWCFFINVIPGLVAAALLFVVLRDPPRPRVSSDVLGLALLVGTLAPLQYALEEGARNDWFSDPGISLALAAGCSCGLAFAVWELYGAPQPIVDLRIFTRAAVRTGSLLSFATGFTLFVGIVLSPQFSQGILGFTATLSGNLVLVRAASIIVFIPIAVIAMGRIKVPPRFVIATGFVLVALAGVLMANATTPISAFWTFGWALALGGFGFGLIFVPVSTSVLSTVGGLDTSKASAMLSLSQQIGASVATAVVVTVIDHRESFHYAMLTSDITLNRIGIAAFLHDGGSLAALSRMVVVQATTLAFADANMLGAVIAGAAAVLALGLRPRRGAARSPANS